MSTRTCRDLEEALAESPGDDGADALSDDLRRHLTDCAECRRTLWLQESLDVAIPAWQSGLPDVDLADAVLARVRIPEAGRSRPAVDSTLRRGIEAPEAGPTSTGSHPRSRGLVAVAAALVVMAVIAWGLGVSPQERPVVNIAPSERESGPGAASAKDAARSGGVTPAEAVADRDLESPDDIALADAVRDAGRAYLALASDAAGAVRDVAILMPTTGLRELRGKAADSDPAPVPSAGDGSPAWKPLRDDVGQALDFLWESLPDTGAPPI